MTAIPSKRTRRREEPETRRKEILDAAISLSLEHGYQNITREQVAVRANTSCPLVSWYFGTMEILKSQVMETAVQQEIIGIIAQGLIRYDPQALNIDPALKAKVINHLID